MTHPLKAAREAQGLSIDDLAARSDVSEKSVRRAEAYEPVNGETRSKLAAGLGLPVETLWPAVAIGSVVSGANGAARISGRNHNGNLIITPVNFGPVEEVSEADLRARYAVGEVAPATQPERRGFEQLASAAFRGSQEIECAQRRTEAAQHAVTAAEARGFERMAEVMEDVR